MDNGCFDFSLAQLLTCFLVNLDLRLTKSDQITTSSTNFSILNMINCAFHSSNGVVTRIKNPTLAARNCTFQTGKNGSLICSGSFLAQGLTRVDANSYLTAKNFDSGAAADEFRLNNSIMDIVSNVSGDVFIGGNSFFEGRAVYGQSILRSSNYNRIVISKALRFEITPGSRLIIDQGTELKIL